MTRTAGPSRWWSIIVLAICLGLALLSSGCRQGPMEDGPPMPKPVVKVTNVVVGFEAPIEGKGLMDSLVSAFATAYPQFSVEGATGDGAGTVAMGEDKTADVLIVRARGAADEFIALALGIEPRPVFHTGHVIVGPASDPARVKGSPTGAEALGRIARRASPFYSEGAASTSYGREKSLWASATVDPAGADWYHATGKTRAETLSAAEAGGGYILIERVAWLQNATAHPGLTVLAESGEDLLDRYLVVQVAGAKNAEGAKAFADWVAGPGGQAAIGAYGVQAYGAQAFVPDAPR